MYAPVFVKAHLAFSLDGKRLEFPNKQISLRGVTGLPWAPLSPELHFGAQVKVRLDLLTPHRVTMEFPAVLMRESSSVSEWMGLQFLPSPEQEKNLKALIAKYGTYPTEYLRKYPRIPATQEMQTFPLHVIGRVLSGPSAQGSPEPTTFTVGNLSPSGILLSTQNQNSLHFQMGTRLHLTIEPRGWFPSPVQMVGLVCRILDETDPKSGNLVRHFGVKFVHMDETQKLIFLDLLRDILSSHALPVEKPELPPKKYKVS